MGVGTTSQRLKATNILDNVYAMYVILERELSSEEIQAAAGNKTTMESYNPLLLTFKIFKKKLADNKNYLLDPNDKLL